ncbi:MULTISPECIES: allophanate hydrolase [Nocardiopsis]|uniref:Allophanate hydrolase n=1 Tax=Nocardiopsis sinuspersici TaxID=501010 RepID=A0A1V3C7G9_9ACTN|nr:MULTISPECIES: allophanate hydrolase [Nocardiopsis]OOC56439.1 allophanate hydrolase [Nocardiopsis sinuspersici]
MPTPTDRVRSAYRRITEADRPEVWITLRPEQDLAVEAKALEERLASGEELPLAGTLVAVKDNIDVAGLPTTAAHPGYAFTPEASAPCVRRLVDAGALVLGKTNLDQFATGLVGTRSPHGAVRGAHDPERIAGGSSSGSAVAVALGMADIALGTDTAGSGRVPAALNGIVGLKPTLGLVPSSDVVPAARPYDCVTVFSRDLASGGAALAVMTGPEPGDPFGRDWPADVRLAARPGGRVAVPSDEALAPLADGERAAFGKAVDALRAFGARTAEVDVSPLLEAARLLYDGALVAERYAAVGEFLAGHPEGADPTVSAIILAAEGVPAHRLAADQHRLASHGAEARRILDGFDALLLPTTVGHPTLEEVAADPVETNSRLGTYTNFVNLLDMAAVAVPAGTVDGRPFGVSVLTRAFEDQVALDLAAGLVGEEPGEAYPAPGVELAVFGAHLRGQPLNHQLTGLGARFVEEALTSADYRMVALPGTAAPDGRSEASPSKPGVLRTNGRGTSLRCEVWRISPAGLGAFLAALPPPMALGAVTLADGRAVVGFACDPAAAEGAEDVSHHGGWLAYLASGRG